MPDESHPSAEIETVSIDAPQFQIAAAHPRRMERSVALLFTVGLLGFAGFGAAYWQNAKNFFLGITLGIGFLGLGAGMVAWGKYLMPRGPFSESRHPLGPSPEEKEKFVEDFGSRGKVAVERRGFLVKILAAASAVFGIVAAFPLLRSLGPLPKKLFYTTAWRKGSYLNTTDGRRVHVDDVDVGGILVVFPDNDSDPALSQTMLVRVGQPGENIVTQKGRENWGPDGYLAFSRVCTHAGCPVALYQQLTHQLLCPCHQSLFDIGPGQAAIPVFGPAPRPLPQLPLSVDSSGYLRARAGYDEPVGPGFWERGGTT
jgi:ubiquinol-cytochrome c reductase iron-sulfur subunit